MWNMIRILLKPVWVWWILCIIWDWMFAIHHQWVEHLWARHKTHLINILCSAGGTSFSSFPWRHRAEVWWEFSPTAGCHLMFSPIAGCHWMAQTELTFSCTGFVTARLLFAVKQRWCSRIHSIIDYKCDWLGKATICRIFTCW